MDFKTLEKQPLHTEVPLDELLAKVKWNEAGLIPAIAQQADTGEVLMLAWMNEQSLLETLDTLQVCYWSRSRQAYWRKGESSGHRQRLRAAFLDCDGDAILLKVEQSGPACHTNRPGCFYIALSDHAGKIVTEPQQ
ncbi:phosphoribosyl-AMP cyclohydrolase [Salinispirillum sp. LH 10-3-1]|uniref:Phosphoribosyl-AMP cyclohydrolase n=1 Tax=Salinispirillum sp. LH 10-3-1 TaxID=2952525 RepID=A0AB38YDM8_9GAMM